MISWNQVEPGLDGTGQAYVSGVCLSTDTKPTDVANGSILLEIDTSKLFMFDGDSKTWKEWS